MQRAQHVFGVITCITFNFLVDKHCVTQFHIHSHYHAREMKFFTVLFVCLSVVSVSAVERKTVSGKMIVSIEASSSGLIFVAHPALTPLTRSLHFPVQGSTPTPPNGVLYSRQARYHVRRPL